MSAQLDAVLRLIDATLGDAVLGVVLYGSAVAGGLRPDSDLDVLVVVTRSLRDADRHALVDGLLPISGRRRGPGNRSIELSVVVRDEVVPWRYPGMLDFQYGDWERSAYEAGMVPGRHERADVVTLLTMARTTGRSLAGPAPADLLDPIPAIDLRRAIVEEVPRLLADLADDTRNVLLTLARVWVTLETGQIVPKDAAAVFVIARLADPIHRAVLAHARAIYLGGADERWPDDLRAATVPCARRMVAQIDRLAGEGTGGG